MQDPRYLRSYDTRTVIDIPRCQSPENEDNSSILSINSTVINTKEHLEKILEILEIIVSIVFLFYSLTFCVIGIYSIVHGVYANGIGMLVIFFIDISVIVYISSSDGLAKTESLSMMVFLIVIELMFLLLGISFV